MEERSYSQDIQKGVICTIVTTGEEYRSLVRYSAGCYLSGSKKVFNKRLRKEQVGFRPKRSKTRVGLKLNARK